MRFLALAPDLSFGTLISSPLMAAKKEHNRRFNNHKNGTNDDRACMLCHTQAGTFQDYEPMAGMVSTKG